jgi:hypothetical protein
MSKKKEKKNFFYFLFSIIADIMHKEYGNFKSIIVQVCIIFSSALTHSIY